MTEEKLQLLKSLHTLLTTMFKGSSFGTLQIDKASESLLEMINEQPTLEVHPLDIPGELLAEACEFGRVKMWQSHKHIEHPEHVKDTWIVLIATEEADANGGLIAHAASAETLTEALQAAIAEARKMGDVK